MRTQKKLWFTLLTIVLTNFLSSAAIFGEESHNKTIFSKKPSAKRQFVHTVFRNGKMIPSVSLPVITITAERGTKNMVKTIKKGNILIAEVNLHEVVIRGEKKTYGCSVRTLAGKNGNTLVMDLPEVAIFAERINPDSFTWIETNDNNIPTVDLPEVIISAGFPESNKVTAVLYKGHLIPAVNLPEIEIKAERTDCLLTAKNDYPSDQSNDMIRKYLPSVEAKTEKSISSVVLILFKAIFLK